MRKNLLLILLFISGFFTLNAQIKLGAEIGFHAASVIENNNLPGWDTAYKPFYSSLTAIHAGIILEIPLSRKLFFQPAINYTSKGRQYLKNNDTVGNVSFDTVYSKSTLSIGYIEVPFYLLYKIPLSANHKNNFFIGAGPYFSFIYNGSLTNQLLTAQDTVNSFSTQTTKLDVGNAVNKYKTFDFGVNAKAGFEFGSVTLSGYISRGLSNFYTAPYSGTFHHQVMGVTLGIWLAKTGTSIPEKPIVKDTDKDGVPDDQDLCPTVPGLKKYNGCPIPDTDHDGVDDEHDSCKTVPGIAKYNGCPIPDTDHDGIDDEHDSCKTVPGVAKYHGCPIPDRDKDGINDEEDKCPDVPGTAANHGCPEIKKEIKEKVNYTAKNILFATASDKLSPVSYAALDDLAKLLIAHKELHLLIEGHTDNVGTDEHNLTLSQMRADAVKNYLINKGVSERNLTATGFGATHPIADNNTAAGKSMNRRVEMKLSNQ